MTPRPDMADLQERVAYLTAANEALQAQLAAIHAEGTPAVQAAWDVVEEHIDYAYQPTPDPLSDPRVIAAIAQARVDALEEAAKVCADNASGFDYTERRWALSPWSFDVNMGSHPGQAYAAAIRNLKGTP